MLFRGKYFSYILYADPNYHVYHVMLDAGCSILDSRYWMLAARRWLLASGEKGIRCKVWGVRYKDRAQGTGQDNGRCKVIWRRARQKVDG